MSNLNGLNIDPNVDENSGGFTVLPAGKYKAVIVGDELVDNKSGTGKLLSLKVQIIVFGGCIVSVLPICKFEPEKGKMKFGFL